MVHRSVIMPPMLAFGCVACIVSHRFSFFVFLVSYQVLKVDKCPKQYFCKMFCILSSLFWIVSSSLQCRSKCGGHRSRSELKANLFIPFVGISSVLGTGKVFSVCSSSHGYNQPSCAMDWKAGTLHSRALIIYSYLLYFITPGKSNSSRCSWENVHVQ